MFSVEPTNMPKNTPVNISSGLAVDYGHCQSDSEDVSSMGFSMSPKDERTSTKKPRKSHDQSLMNQRSGHWDEDQNRKYYLFLQHHHLNFQKKNLRRSQKIFKVMSRYLGTRTADQCRSHHQKMEKKCLTFQKILEHLSESFIGVPNTCNFVKEYNTRARRDCVPRMPKTEAASNSVDTLKEIDTAVTALFDEEEFLIMPRILQPLYVGVLGLQTSVCPMRILQHQ